MKKSVSPKVYTKEYFLTHCDGWEDFLESKGFKLRPRFLKAINLANPGPEQTVLDVGCGRGEMILNCSLRGSTSVGIDYSFEAIVLARESHRLLPAEIKSRIFLSLADSKSLPFKSETFDTIFLLDVVEHLYSWELHNCLKEIFRVLKDNGLVIIHTSPNLWRKYVYPIKKIFGRALGINVSTLDEGYFREQHVNLQSPLSLRKILKQHEFYAKIWVDAPESNALYLQKGISRKLGIFLYFLINRSPLCHLGNDIYAIVQKSMRACYT